MAHAVEKSMLAPAVNGAGASAERAQQPQAQPAQAGIAGGGQSTISKSLPNDLIVASLALFGDRQAQGNLTPEQQHLKGVLEQRMLYNNARFAPILQAMREQEMAAKAANGKSDAAKPDDAKKA